MGLPRIIKCDKCGESARVMSQYGGKPGPDGKPVPGERVQVIIDCAKCGMRLQERRDPPPARP